MECKYLDLTSVPEELHAQYRRFDKYWQEQDAKGTIEWVSKVLVKDSVEKADPIFYNALRDKFPTYKAFINHSLV